MGQKVVAKMQKILARHANQGEGGGLPPLPGQAPPPDRPGPAGPAGLAPGAGLAHVAHHAVVSPEGSVLLVCVSYFFGGTSLDLVRVALCPGGVSWDFD